ncbi:uncharacterized protein [Palaemon carinicauda]|uniref:uncharacterized protein n=1 Tax=Palaemon carinicauda TaxID=392227 RepID=UPI0035B68291
MGLNCHFIARPRPTYKRLEMELLLDSILNLQERGALRTTDALQPLLLAKALIDRGRYSSAAFVLINTHEYTEKLDAILPNLTKFERLTSDPVEDNKREANHTIKAINTATNAIHLPMISGDYGPSYLYGNVRTHKQGNRLRPIISQCPTPTYQLAKKLNTILTLYVPDCHCMASSAKFLERIKNVREQALLTLLAICTKRAPFTTHHGHMYFQKDGVAMGSPLGVLFANFYMGIVDERVFSQLECPLAYFLYIDDTFVKATSTEAIENLSRTFKDNSVLHLTLENSVDNSLPFLDVLISSTNEEFQTTVYTKPTNLSMCLNGESECPARYRALTIKGLCTQGLVTLLVMN